MKIWPDGLVAFAVALWVVYAAAIALADRRERIRESLESAAERIRANLPLVISAAICFAALLVVEWELFRRMP